jgi:hypothetical protein
MVARTEPLTPERRVEAAACATDPLYFLDRFGRVYDALAKEWLPFHVWPAQSPVLDALDREQLLVVLKARQLGLTWLALGYILWLMTFWPAATVLLFSKREEESVYLLGEERLRGMWRRLPSWLRVPAAKPDGATAWALANGSVARAFPANAGDSYTASLALVDEADLVPDLDTLLGRVKPTVDAGGKLVLLSRADKSRPESPFKQVYRAARSGENDWCPLFLPWHAHPGRGGAWYESQRRDVLARTGSLDDLHEQYPATEAEALSPRTLDKRIAPAWLEQCYAPRPPLWPLPPGAPSLPGLEVYRVPQPGRTYFVGMDPAEGNPQSDDSALTVLDAATGEECAALAGRHEPAVFAAHGAAVARWYNHAGVLVERNNHGHAVLLWLREHGGLWLVPGHDDREGWLSSAKGKAVLYDAASDAFRDGQAALHSLATFTQLASVEGSTLRAPEGQKDDRAVGYVLALWAASRYPGAFSASSLGAGGGRVNAMPAGVFGRRGGGAGRMPPGVFGR